MSVLRKPFIFMLRHKVAYEQGSSLRATSKGPNEQVDRKCTFAQFKALQPCYTVKIDAGSPSSTN